MRERIKAELGKIEESESVRILYACESGSRAWGFASQDSDYDVRFIYVRPVNWYLSVDAGRDVIERPIDDLLDISGWDLRKALKLFCKSNPPLFEWLSSPTVYLEQYSTAKQMQRIAGDVFNSRAAMHHYLNMADSNYREYLHGLEVKAKKYFYVLRPILACQWIARLNTKPPMEFDLLVESQISDAKLILEIKALLKRKMSGREMDMQPRINIINDFIDEALHRLREYTAGLPKEEPFDFKRDDLFRKSLQEVWGIDLMTAC